LIVKQFLSQSICKDSLIVKIFFQQGNDKRVQKSTANTFFLHENVCCAYGSVF